MMTRLTVAELLVITGLAISKSEAKRLVKQGGVRVDHVVVTDAKAHAPYGLWSVGTRRFVEVAVPKTEEASA